MKAETKYRGSLKLSAIGDALGWITEFEKSQSSLLEKYGVDRVEKFYDWQKNVGGRFYGFVDDIKAGSYSDDTQLLLAVARSIKSNGDVDHEYFSKEELPNWLNYARGGGRTVKTAARKISRKSTKWYNNFFMLKVNSEVIDYKQSGANGAAMRVLPIALANLGNVDKIKEEIFCNSIITHGHPRAILGAMLYGYAINEIIIYRPETFSWEAFITQIGKDFPEKFVISFSNRNEIKKWLNEWNLLDGRPFLECYNEVISEAQHLLRQIYSAIKKDISTHETLKSIGCFDPTTKGSGLGTVIAGIYLAAKFHDKPLEAITEAVNILGTDTDSIAAFTGGLIGALHGQSIIPEKWKNVQDVDYIDSIANMLLSISEDNYKAEFSKNSETLPVINDLGADNFKVDEEIVFRPLGAGKIISVDRQPTLTKGKYTLILEAQLHIGQTIKLTKIFDDPSSSLKENRVSIQDSLLSQAEAILKPKALESLKSFLSKHPKVSTDLAEILRVIMKNEE